MAIKTITELKARARACGSHFFDAQTMRFFASKVHKVYPLGDDGAIFVTSEKTGNDGFGPARQFKVRDFSTVTCSVSTVDQPFTNLAAAVEHARWTAGGVVRPRHKTAKARLAPPDLLGSRRRR